MGALLVLGVAALLFLGLSVFYCARRKFGSALIHACLELLSSSLMCVAWADALRISGKKDWRLLGIRNYPALGLFCYAVLAAGGALIVWNAVKLCLSHKRK